MASQQQVSENKGFLSSLKYSQRDLKGDFISGSVNGMLFGIFYSYFFLPFEMGRPDIAAKMRNSKALYCAVNTIKLGLMFGLVKSSFNLIEKQKLSTSGEVVSKIAVAFSVVSIV